MLSEKNKFNSKKTMLTNKFKSKAKNIALKSFIYEMKRLRLYNKVMQSTVGMLTNKSNRADKFVKSMNTELMRPHFHSLFLRKKELFKKVLEKMDLQIEYNFKHSKNKDEYNYLVHCVNTFIQVYIEWVIGKHVGITEKDLGLIGEKVFDRAGKKIFGKEFEIKAPQTSKINNKIDPSKPSYTKSELLDLLLSSDFGTVMGSYDSFNNPWENIF